MKKVFGILILIPVIIYSIIWGVEQLSVDYTSSNSSYNDYFLPMLGIFFILSIIVIIIHIFNCLRGQYSGKEASVYSLILKLAPIYPCLELIPLLLVGVIVPFIGWISAAVLIVYLCSIMGMTGTVMVGSIICLFREKKIGVALAILFGFLSYVPGADIIVAIILLVYAFKK